MLAEFGNCLLPIFVFSLKFQATNNSRLRRVTQDHANKLKKISFMRQTPPNTKINRTNPTVRYPDREIQTRSRNRPPTPGTSSKQHTPNWKTLSDTS